MRMHVGSADVGGLIEVVEYHPPGDLAWTSITGIDQRGRWRLRETRAMAARAVIAAAELRGAGRPGGGDHRPAVGAGGAGQPAPRPGTSESESGRRGSGDRAGKGTRRDAGPRGGQREGADRRGHHPADPARQAGAPRLATLVRWGRSPAAGFIAGAVTSPHEPAVIDELGTLTFGEVDRRTNALAHGRRRRRHQGGRRRGHHVPQPPRLRRGHGGRQARRPRALPQHRVRGPAAHRGREAREAAGDHLRRGVRRPARGTPASGASASSPGTTRTTSPTRRSRS